MSQDGQCGVCGKVVGSFDLISVAGVGDRCHPCFNREMADRLGIDFDHTPFQPIVIADADGVPHTFQVRSMLVATGHEMEALEITNDGELGYCFRVLGDVEADAWALFRELYANMRREMARRHVEQTESGWQLTADHRLVGRIEWWARRSESRPVRRSESRPLEGGSFYVLRRPSDLKSRRSAVDMWASRGLCEMSTFP